MMEILHKFGLTGASVVPALIGAVIKTSQGVGKSIWQHIIGVMTGVFTSAFMTPLVVESLSLSQAAQNGVAFALGYLGLSIIEVMMERWRD